MESAVSRVVRPLKVISSKLVVGLTLDNKKSKNLKISTAIAEEAKVPGGPRARDGKVPSVSLKSPEMAAATAKIEEVKDLQEPVELVTEPPSIVVLDTNLDPPRPPTEEMDSGARSNGFNSQLVRVDGQPTNTGGAGDTLTSASAHKENEKARD